MKSALLGAIFGTSLLVSPAANAWDLQKLRDAHNFSCEDVGEIGKEASSRPQATVDETAAVRNIAAAITDELYDQDALWVSSGHKSYIHEIPRNALPKVVIKILKQCQKNLSRNMAEQVDESFVNFATYHWNPFADPDFNPLELEEEPYKLDRKSPYQDK